MDDVMDGHSEVTVRDIDSVCTQLAVCVWVCGCEWMGVGVLLLRSKFQLCCEEGILEILEMFASLIKATMS